ncbi:hypothetical protein [Spiroplasma turonicum]|uniref:Transmembrane protein n=1 Tax=Spiroplasma turonicum TaxID=216946 RepID=A0A0K1P5A7_9MOLU|nr:hypothetical protein [Spiroplasma turonicum]AKU79473.1 hypothetical protein STURON_00227 [Spiroplasma turonicum]ALX70495.1 hypothetical protein STURO_v1c02260 [Spiroplasma turonicum]
MNKIKLIFNIFLPIAIISTFVGTFIFLINISSDLSVNFIMFTEDNYVDNSFLISQSLVIIAILVNLVFWFFSLLTKELKVISFIKSFLALFLLISSAYFLILLYLQLDELSFAYINISILLNYSLLALGSALSLTCFILFLVYSIVLNKKPKRVIKRSPSIQSEPVSQNSIEESNDEVYNETAFNVSNEEKPNLVEESFTSTPNEETFNISDKLSELKHNLHNNVLPNDEEVEQNINLEEHNNNDSSVDEDISEYLDENTIDDFNREQILDNNDINPTTFVRSPIVNNGAILSNSSNNNKIKNNDTQSASKASMQPNKEAEYKGPIDPYKQTIVPRRFSSVKSGKFEGPIGNIVKNLSSSNKENRKKPVYDQNYQGKIFLGDSDRIWDALKKQASDVYKNENFEKKDNNLEKNKILDPLNSVENLNDEQKSVSTIDWDD